MAPVSPILSGFLTKGDIRNMDVVNINGNKIIVVARNNGNLHFYKY